jgi:mannosyltransferase OCH1-like enzyme
VIPKLIHQTARTRDLPADVRGYVERVKAVHPDWQYHLWTDEENLELVRARVPEFIDVFQKLPKNIMRADVIRYVLMYVHGGLYLDTDYEMLKPFDLTDRDVVLPLERDGTTGEPLRPCNSIFASAPGHALWRMAIDDLIADPPLGAQSGDDVLVGTGPQFLTRILHKARAAGVQVYTPEPILFNPTTPRLRRQYDAIVRDGRSYGIHHCVGSWRDFTMAEKFKNSVYRLLGKIA